MEVLNYRVVVLGSVTTACQFLIQDLLEES